MLTTTSAEEVVTLAAWSRGTKFGLERDGDSDDEDCVLRLPDERSGGRSFETVPPLFGIAEMDL